MSPLFFARRSRVTVPFRARHPKFAFQPDQQALDEAKLELCYWIDREVTFSHGATYMARKLGTSKAALSRVGNKRLDQLTFNQLFRYLAIAMPGFQILISPPKR